MPRGKTASRYSLAERRRVAFSLFTKGFTNEQVAKELNVHKGTVKQYRDAYDEEIALQVQANPNLLRDALKNTVQALGEIDEVRRSAWQEYEAAQHDLTTKCPSCEHEFVVQGAPSITTRNQLLKTITAAQDQRAKLLGLFGVKAEFLHHVNAVRLVQERLLQFMRQHLCAADKAKLETLMMGELREHFMTASNMPAIPAELTSGGSDG